MDNYAIISLGGKQYRVHEGERLVVDRLKFDEGKTFKPSVLFAPDGAQGVEVTVKVNGHVLGDKIRIGKYRPKNGFKRHNGHRSRLTEIEIASIGKKAAKAAAKPKAEAAARSDDAPDSAPKARSKQDTPEEATDGS
jgi:large subunit ribosomal protein L21